MPPQLKGNKKVVWTLEDAAHFIIFRELSKLGVPDPYQKATAICKELRHAVSYRKANY